ncbi:MAG: class I SAM-dependent methyltransferase [Nitrospirae bacterium]|nr:class I SAM-dependent methyltransferase [Nitrospirota bacterium]
MKKMHSQDKHKEDICPVAAGYLLICPVRRLIHNPESILRPYIREGMTVLDIGPAMGYFTIPMAKMVGETGIVIAVDIQEEMLKKLQKRALHAGVAERIVLIQADTKSLGLNKYKGMVDFALAFAVVHEVPDADTLFREVFISLKDGGKVLFVEPKGHVSRKKFDESIVSAEKAGFRQEGYPTVFLSHSVLLVKACKNA